MIELLAACGGIIVGFGLGAVVRGYFDYPSLEPLKEMCDREWKDENNHQIIAIAANAIYWRNKTIDELRRAARGAKQPATPSPAANAEEVARKIIQAEPSVEAIAALLESFRAETLGRCAQVADQYYRQLSTNGVASDIHSVASDIRDDILALSGDPNWLARQIAEGYAKGLEDATDELNGAQRDWATKIPKEYIDMWNKWVLDIRDSIENRALEAATKSKKGVK